MVMKLQIFRIKKFYYAQAFLKECKYIEKKVVRHIIDDLESSYDNSDDSNEE